jgi:hypothetical protein
MRFKINNELKEPDYRRLREFLKKNSSASIELFPGADFEFLSVSPVVVVVEGFDYKISIEVLFREPIGFEIFDDLKLDDDVRSVLAVNRRNFRLSKIVTEESELEGDVNRILKTVERVVNHVCNRFGRVIEQTFNIDSGWLDSQLELVLKREELEKRGEIPRPFGMIHAEGSRDAKERAGDLIPIYMETDKAYLYEDKKVFILLPRDFGMKLLKLEGGTMLSADQFTDEERKALDKFSMRQYVKTRRIGGKIYYRDLDEKTRKLLLKGMKKKPHKQ